MRRGHPHLISRYHILQRIRWNRAAVRIYAAEHALARSLATDETREAVEKYIFDSSMRSNVDRMQAKDKTGVFTAAIFLGMFLVQKCLASMGNSGIIPMIADCTDYEMYRSGRFVPADWNRSPCRIYISRQRLLSCRRRLHHADIRVLL